MKTRGYALGRNKYKRKRNRMGRRIAVLTTMTILVAASGLTIWKVLMAAEDPGRGGYPAVETSARAPGISAGAAVVIDAEDGMVLYEYNADEKMYPASTTKIMTALVVLETMEQLELGLSSEIVVPDEAQGVEGSSLYLKAGEQVSVEELLYGLMLQSGNDSAVALAACIGGSTEHFVEKMNLRAEELGCRGTHFTNPNGLYDENHYTTARDLAYIARAAMMREDFRQIVGTRQWSNEESENGTGENDAGEEAPGRWGDTLVSEGAGDRGDSGGSGSGESGSGSEKSSESGSGSGSGKAEPAARTPRTFVNKNKTIFQYEGGDGVKIGFTKASGRTLVASACRDGHRVIAVVLNDGNWFQDAYHLMDFGFAAVESGT